MVEKGVLHSAARPRLLCRGDGDGRKGGTSLGRELGLRRVARFSLAHADEGAPGRLVQQGAVGEVHLVEDFPPLVHCRRACAEIKFRVPRFRARLLDGVST